MAVVAMKKLSVIAQKHDTDAIIRSLMWLSCVEIETADFLEQEENTENKNTSPVIYSDNIPAAAETGYTETSLLQKRLGSTIKKLKAYLPKDAPKDGLFTKKPTVLKTLYDSSSGAFVSLYDISERVEEITYSEAELSNEKQRLRDSLSSLGPWKDCTIPLDITHTKETKIIFGTLPLGTSVEETAAAVGELCSVNEVSSDLSAVYITVFYHISADKEVRDILSSYGFNKIDMGEYEGSAEVNINRLGRAIEKIEEEQKKLKLELTELSQNIPELKIAYDYTSTRLIQLNAKRKLKQTRETVMFSGWLPENMSSLITEELNKYCCAWELTDPLEEDNVPILLSNPEPSKSFETVVGLYSLPAYKTFDPTIIMSFFYFVIFGLMFADFVYGLLLAAGGFLLLKFTDFDDGVKRLIKLFAICGIASMAAGVLFGSYMGDLPVVIMDKIFGKQIEAPYIAFDPLADPISFLLIALAVGVVHLLTGLGIQFYIKWSQGHPFAAIFDIGSWFVLFGGIGVFVFSNIIGTVIVLTGVLMLLLSQGRDKKNIFLRIGSGLGALYGSINYAADLLSYSRIMALGMASAVIASVVNLMSTLPGKSVIGYVLMAVILLVGHTLNIAINLLGTFVHTNRLQYIEFFGKFYADGGRPFKPIKPQTQYSRIKTETKKK